MSISLSGRPHDTPAGESVSSGAPRPMPAPPFRGSQHSGPYAGRSRHGNSRCPSLERTAAASGPSPLLRGILFSRGESNRKGGDSHVAETCPFIIRIVRFAIWPLLLVRVFRSPSVIHAEARVEPASKAEGCDAVRPAPPCPVRGDCAAGTAASAPRRREEAAPRT
jgi:hypothetical protein